jgi:hypothetical protein
MGGAGIKSKEVKGNRAVVIIGTNNTVPGDITPAKNVIFTAANVKVLALKVEPLATGLASNCSVVPCNCTIARTTRVAGVVIGSRG